jgi:hypothetical protein
LGAVTASGRKFPKRAHALLYLVIASSLGCDVAVGRMVEAAVERQRSAGHTEWLDDGALHVLLCGTGAPLADPTSGADILVHEVLLKDLAERVSDGFGRAGEPRLQRLTADIIDYHTSPSEALRAAQQAGVDTMVMTHLVPPLPARLRSWFFTRGLETGDVDVVVGEDGLHFRLPADSEIIEHEALGS